MYHLRSEMSLGRSVTVLCIALWAIAAQMNVFTQTSDSVLFDDVSIQSWKKGHGRIAEGQFNLILSSNDDEFVADIKAYEGGKKYRLSIKKSFVQTLRKPSIQCWVVTLKELQPLSSEGFLLGGNLLSEEAPGGLHRPTNFLCPIETPKNPFDSGHYSIWQKRIFLIEAFQIGVSVKNYEFDEKENRLLSTEISLAFTNEKR